MIAVGGSIGTGLFVGSGQALRRGGPAGILIAWSLIGVMLVRLFSFFTRPRRLGGLADRLYPADQRYASSWRDVHHVSRLCCSARRGKNELTRRRSGTPSREVSTLSPSASSTPALAWLSAGTTFSNGSSSSLSKSPSLESPCNTGQTAYRSLPGSLVSFLLPPPQSHAANRLRSQSSGSLSSLSTSLERSVLLRKSSGRRA